MQLGCDLSQLGSDIKNTRDTFPLKPVLCFKRGFEGGFVQFFVGGFGG